MFIGVAGLIGAGKSTLTKSLADRLGYKAYFEPVESNPYLEDFYKDISRWTFNMQLFLLAHRSNILTYHLCRPSLLGWSCTH